MNSSALAPSLFHPIPDDISYALNQNPLAVESWERISTIARNEWICWTITVKQEKTRQQHIVRMIDELASGKSRPCCWVGCFHRTDKPAGAWAQKVLIDKAQKS